MTTETEPLALRARIAELESRVDFRYSHLGLAPVKAPSAAEGGVVDMLRKSSKIEAINLS